MNTRRGELSDAERTVLRVLWEQGPATVRQVHQALESAHRRWAYTTVLTLLNRLERKGAAARDRSGFAHVYRAAVTRDQLLADRLDGVADELCDGAKAPLVLALVQGHRFTPDQISEFRRLLDRPPETRRKRRR